MQFANKKYYTNWFLGKWFDIRVYIYIYILTHITHTHVCARAHTHTHTHTHKYMYMYMYMYIYMGEGIGNKFVRMKSWHVKSARLSEEDFISRIIYQC